MAKIHSKEKLQNGLQMLCWGKAYVFTKRYDSAKTYLLKVINNGVNSLMPFSQYKMRLMVTLPTSLIMNLYLKLMWKGRLQAQVFYFQPKII